VTAAARPLDAQQTGMKSLNSARNTSAPKKSEIKPRSWRPSQQLLDRIKALDIRNESKFVLEAVEARVEHLEASKQAVSAHDVRVRDLAMERDTIEKEIKQLENDPIFVKNKRFLTAINSPDFVEEILGGGYEKASREDADHFRIPSYYPRPIEQWDDFVKDKPVYENIVKSHQARIDALRDKYDSISRELSK